VGSTVPNLVASAMILSKCLYMVSSMRQSERSTQRLRCNLRLHKLLLLNDLLFSALSHVGAVAAQAFAAANTTDTGHSYERPLAALLQG
jgi:hypothetical protein